MSALPGVSVVIPTLNAEKYLDECLAALRDQDYPAELVEILLVDAGSTDRTLELAEAHGVDQVLANPLRTGEAGKAVGLRAAQHDLFCMVDSDNVVVGRDWLRRMVAPFEEEAIVSSEALRWDYRREDHFINRYQALTGINDPLALFIGNYDRWSELTGRWTDYPHHSEQRDGWERVELDPRYVPTMGANGYIVRRRALDVVPVDDYFFDIDFVYDLVQRGERTVARSRRSGAALLLRLCPALLLEDAPAHRRLLLLLARRPPQLSVDTAAAPRGHPLHRLDGARRPPARPGAARIAAQARPGLAVPRSRVLDHPWCLRRRLPARALRAEDARPGRLAPVSVSA